MLIKIVLNKLCYSRLVQYEVDQRDIFYIHQFGSQPEGYGVAFVAHHLRYTKERGLQRSGATGNECGSCLLQQVVGLVVGQQYIFAAYYFFIKTIGLVNLIMDKEVVKELIQDDFNPQQLEQQLRRLLEDPAYIRSLKQDYEELWQKLGEHPASQQAAEEIVQLLGK